MRSEITTTIAKTSTLPIAVLDRIEIYQQVRLDLTITVSRDEKSDRLVEIHEYQIIVVRSEAIPGVNVEESKFGQAYHDLHSAYTQYNRVNEVNLSNHERYVSQSVRATSGS